ncbi:hypothetical protein [Lactococcus lactis]|uniref:hypothetical protein n=1 Tax=Lactococcus lactis TaxID=1358 RepID=UPI001F5790EF|nr:hypothetical protein [Lactococcus lactis]
MVQTERWNLKNIPTEIKEKIKELAKKDAMNANEKVAEILNDYLYDIELGQNKNYFDKRWQQVIDSYNASANAQKILAEVQIENTEAFGKSFSTLTKQVLELKEEVEILRGVQQMMLGYSPEESLKFAEYYKKFTGQALKNTEDIQENRNDQIKLFEREEHEEWERLYYTGETDLDYESWVDENDKRRYL